MTVNFSIRLSILFAAFAILLRPTNAFIWIAIGTLALTRLTLDGHSPFTGTTVFVLVREALLCGYVTQSFRRSPLTKLSFQLPRTWRVLIV
jgi:hypothetical protein